MDAGATLPTSAALELLQNQTGHHLTAKRRSERGRPRPAVYLHLTARRLPLLTGGGVHGASKVGFHLRSELR